MAQEQNEEITPLNADELNVEQLEDVAGGNEEQSADDEFAAGECGTFKCGINW